MKVYAIYDEELDRSLAIGYLFYYENSKSFIIELCEDMDEWEAPLLFQRLVREKRYTVPRDISLMWVQERVIPSGRQNIGSILKNHRMKEYSEMAFLHLSRGRCSQDSCYIAEISEEEIPENIKARRSKNIWECFPVEEDQIVCLFQDDVAKKVELARLSEYYKDLNYVLKNRELMDSVKVGAGGYSIVFNDAIEVQASDLRNVGQLIPLRARDFYRFASRNVLDATKTCDLLQCSRQNLSYLVKEEKITPIIRGTKENLYLKGEIEKVMSE